ncbi:A-kinase anchor protein 1, mitochondrial [Aphelenchoides besseyi]|nr:A-kinase anchor protein 1, mitochondrial [Aphelenchoides besseyi]KAI6201740.1 A-kinase anchor protein 1, mitochondrial [Aphelenchoides besseyi]
MSTTLGRRLFIAALGVATSLTVMYLIAERRRRKQHLRTRGLSTAAISSVTELNSAVEEEDNQQSIKKPQNKESKAAIEAKSSETVDEVKTEETADSSVLTSETREDQPEFTTVPEMNGKHEDKQEMVSAEDHTQLVGSVAETPNHILINNIDTNHGTDSYNMTSTNHNTKSNNPELYVDVKQQNGLQSQPNKSHRSKSPVNTVKSKMEKSKFPSQQSKNDTKITVIKDSTLTPIPGENGGYQNAESPSGTSTNSDGSADSGRATGGPNCSPFDNHTDMELKPVYEFEVPNTLVGLIIGIQGKTITELCRRASVRMLIRPHHTPARFETHQICSIEGPRSNINKCLHMIRYRFPTERFPDLNLKPVLPPTMVECTGQMIGNDPSTLSLPVGVPCEAFICNVVDPGHFFVQLPTHPTFSSLANLDFYTMSIYSHLSAVPVLPKPCVAGVVCIAPTPNGWFRAITLDYNESDDTVVVRLADYGGFLQLPRAELRQIRSDLTSLPMQAIECYLAHVQPVDGTMHWSEEATALFSKLCASRIVQAELIGYNKENNIPYVEIYATDEEKKVHRVDTILLDRGFAKPLDPTKMIQVQPIGKANAHRKPTLSESSNRR